jgi:hypothetical membrane protein
MAKKSCDSGLGNVESACQVTGYRDRMRSVPGWALASALGAPVLLIGGWTLAAALQPAGYDPVTQTISALAARGAADSWLMTSALAGLGGCHLVTALGLRPAARAGRILLAAGGAATVLVAAFPQPVEGSSAAHVAAATTAFVALAGWPALAADRTRDAGWGLRPGVSAAATAVLAGTVAWFGWELHTGTGIGLAERVAAGSQALWPLAVVIAERRRRRPGTSATEPR